MHHVDKWGKLGSVFKSPARVAGFDDVAMMGEAIEHGGCHFGVAEHLRPIGECQIDGDQQRRVLIELADEVKQQLSAGLTERQIAEFVDDDEIVAQQLLGQAAAAAGRPCSSWLTRSTRLKNRPLARVRMTVEATAMHRWVLPVPVPPMKIALRLASRKVPVASSRTCPSSTGVSAKTNLSRSLRTGNLEWQGQLL